MLDSSPRTSALGASALAAAPAPSARGRRIIASLGAVVLTYLWRQRAGEVGG